MEWYVVQSQDLHGIISSLGSKVGEEYKVGEKCLDSLREILSCLVTEDQIIRNFRRALGMSQIIKKDLIPLLIYSKYDKKITDATIRVLVNLTLPVECLLPVESVSQIEGGTQIISDLNNLLISAKQEFVNPQVTLCLIQRIKSMIDMERKLSPDDCENIGNCLVLLRNVLHVPEHKTNKLHSLNRMCHSPLESNCSGSNNGCSKQNCILWNLFAQNFDKILLQLMTCQQRAEWEVPFVQLIALTFKDQRMTSLLRMLHVWLESSMSSESSEDNESNTSPQPLNQSSGNSSPMLTSEATSDSSDNGGGIIEGDKSGRSKAHCENLSDNRGKTKGHEDASTVKAKEKKSECTAEQSCTLEFNAYVNSENIIQVEQKYKPPLEKKEEKDDKVNGEDKSRAVLRKQSRRMSENADSGFFSQKNKNLPSPGNNKIQSHQRSAHHYPHHRCAHPFQRKGGKKNSFLPSSVSSTSQRKGLAMSEQSDCGYSTQVENQPETISTSSNEDEEPIAKRKLGHQKHYNARQHHKADINNLGNNANLFQQQQVQRCGEDQRRKRLVKHSRMHSINFKAMVYYNPTDEDISNLLKEFTLDFMSQAYSLLVSGLHIKLLSSCSHRVPGIKSVHPPPVNFSCSSIPFSSMFRPVKEELPPPPIDTSHFFWLITFFLRFSSQLGLEFENISTVLSYDILSYLVFEGVGLCEEMELAIHYCRESDIQPCIRRMHLVVTAIREFVQAAETYGKMAVTMPGREGDRVHLQMLQKQMASTRDLRCLFVLLLQHYNISIMSRQYLQDIVVTNHVLLLFLESGGGLVEPEKVNCEMNGKRRNSLVEELEMAEHISHFANGSIIQQYGHLLEAFQENGEFVNDCIFTMLHHIGGDVNRSEVLFQPNLLRTFSAMWESDFNMCDDWSDLIEYIIYKFIARPQCNISGKSVKNIPLVGKRSTRSEQKHDDVLHSWSAEELRDLNFYYSKCCDQNNVLDCMVMLYQQEHGVRKTPKEVLKALLYQEVISFHQFTALKNEELTDDNSLDNLISRFSPSAIEKDAEKLAASLIEEGLEKVIHWLQDALLEASYVKLHMKRETKEGYNYNCMQLPPVMEPVAYHYALMGQPIPIVPWGVEEQKAVIENISFGHLLQCLGIQRPRGDGIGGIFPRIPISLSPLELLEAAQKLGKLTPGKLKFDPVELNSERKGAVEIWEGGQKHTSSPMSSVIINSNISPKSSPATNCSHKPVKNFSTENNSPPPAYLGSQSSSSEMNSSMIRSSNINWLNIVKKSKSSALIMKNHLKNDEERVSDKKEELLNTK